MPPLTPKMSIVYASFSVSIYKNDIPRQTAIKIKGVVCTTPFINRDEP